MSGLEGFHCIHNKLGERRIGEGEEREVRETVYWYEGQTETQKRKLFVFWKLPNGGQKDCLQRRDIWDTGVFLSAAVFKQH